MTLSTNAALVSVSDNGATPVALAQGAAFVAGAGDGLTFTLTNPSSPTSGVQWTMLLTFAGGDVTPPPQQTARLDQGQTSLSFSMPTSYLVNYTSTVTDTSGTKVIATGILKTTAGNTTSQLGNDIDVNSIIWGDVSQNEWQRNVSNMFNRAMVGTGIDGYVDGVWLNAIQASVAYVLKQAFSPPPGVTQVAFELDGSLAPGVASSTVTIQIQSANGGSILATTNCVLTAGAQTFTTGPLAVTPGTIYQAAILFGGGTGPSAASSVLVTRVRVRPIVTSQALFSAAFVRLNATGRILWGNVRDGINTAILTNVPIRLQSPYVRLCFWTNATTIGIQLCNTTTPINALSGAVAVHVGGRALTTVIGVSSTIDVQYVTLPAGYNYVEIEASDQSLVTNSVAAGDFVLGVFVPQSASLQVQPQKLPDTRYYAIYDSKGGYGATAPVLNGWIPLTRRSMPKSLWYHDGHAGRRVSDDCLTLAGTQLLAARIVQANPTTILMFGYHRNDWALASLTPVQVGQMLKFLIDLVHDDLPHANFILCSTPSETSEAANGLGFTLQNYRDACTRNIANCRPDYVRFLDCTSGNVTGWNNGTCLSVDGIHPNDFGYGVLWNFFTQQATLFDQPPPSVGQTSVANTVRTDTLSTTNATPATSAFATMAVPTGCNGRVIATITAFTSTLVAHGKFSQSFRNVSGTLTLAGSLITEVGTAGTLVGDAGLTTAAFAFTVSTTNIVPQITGIAATNIQWRLAVEYVMDQ